MKNDAEMSEGRDFRMLLEKYGELGREKKYTGQRIKHISRIVFRYS